MSGDVGKTTRAKGLDYRAPNIATPTGVPGIPGKATLAGNLKPTSAADIGNPYIEGRGHCQAPAAPGAAGSLDGCFLSAAQRTLLVDAYQKVVMQAQMQFTAALVELKLDKIMQKDDDAAGLGFILDVFASVALGGISSVLTMIKGKPKTAIDGLESMLALQSGEESEDETSLHHFMEGSGAAIGWIVKSSVDFGKKSLKGGKPATEKNVAINYIETLQNASTIAWQHQVFDPPGFATDADLIVLFHAFKAENGHTEPLYKQAINEKIERYTSSLAARIGRNPARTQKDFDVQGNTTRDTKVAWMAQPGGKPPVLYYLKQDAPNHQSPHTLGNHDIEMLEPIDKTFVWAAPVEPEFADVALSRHRDIWGSEPETRPHDTSAGFDQNDPRTWDRNRKTAP